MALPALMHMLHRDKYNISNKSVLFRSFKHKRYLNISLRCTLFISINSITLDININIFFLIYYFLKRVYRHLSLTNMKYVNCTLCQNSKEKGERVCHRGQIKG